MTERLFTLPPSRTPGDRRSGMSSHQSASAVTTTWLTPLWIIDALGGFDLDPCGYPGHPTAHRLICRPDDGLEEEWSGRVWLNPPYGREVGVWLEKLVEHGDGIALIFARTETDAFFREVWECADGVLFIRGRVTFLRPDGEKATSNSGAPSCLVAFGSRNLRALEVSNIPGALVTDWCPQ